VLDALVRVCPRLPQEGPAVWLPLRTVPDATHVAINRSELDSPVEFPGQRHFPGARGRVGITNRRGVL